MRSPLLRILALSALVVPLACGPPAERDKVVILVVDGLRPDYVTPELMPRLNALADRGVRGLAHHAVFPTVTRVNGPSIFTGRYPSGHGMMGNSVYLPDVDSSRVLDAGNRADLLAIEAAGGGTLMTAPSLGELLEERGLVYFAASSGSTGSGTLMNHTGAGAGLVHHEFTLPESLGAVVAEVLGPAPQAAGGSSAVPLVRRALDALLLIGLDREDADVLAGWLTEPDGTAHARGIGSPSTVEVLGSVDAEIGRFLDELAARDLLDRTNLLVTSDHGFTTRTGRTSLSALLVEAGLKESARSMDVVVAGDAIHVREGGTERVAAIVRLLQSTDWIGPVFTPGAAGASGAGSHNGTIAFSAIGWQHERTADVLTSAAWSDAANEFGYRGEVFTPGVAGHGSSSPWDIRATFVAAGPGVKVGVTSAVPTGNIDLVPTTLALLGEDGVGPFDGRVFEEALLGGPDPDSVEVRLEPVTVSTQVGDVRYELTAHRTFVGPTMYFDGTDVVRTRPSEGAGGRAP